MPPSNTQNDDVFPELDYKFGALRTLSSILVFISYLIIIATVISGFGLLSETTGPDFIYVIPLLVVGLLTALVVMALAQLVRVVLSIEENTRRSNTMLQTYATSELDLVSGEGKEEGEMQE